MPKLDNETILIVFVAITGLAVLLQAIILLAIYVAMRKAAERTQKEIEALRTSLVPLIDETRDVLASTQRFFGRVAPKIEAVATDLAEITRGLRLQSVEVQCSVEEILERVRAESRRLDGILSNLLDNVERAEDFVNLIVSKPVRQVSAILRAAKAIINSLRTHPTQHQQTHIGEGRSI